jgi:hypothetical protein
MGIEIALEAPYNARLKLQNSFAQELGMVKSISRYQNSKRAITTVCLFG